MVPFAGYELPVQYAGEGGGVMKEHLHVRADNSAGIFDVGHMGQIKWHGKDAAKFLEMVVCGDIASLKPSEGKLSLIMNESGGIMDDCVISHTTEDYIYMVVNGACKHKDMAHFEQYLSADGFGRGLDVGMEYMHEQQLLAVQGKGAARALQDLAPELKVSAMNFMTSTLATVAGIRGCRVTRCGYTGEDGFEVSVEPTQALGLLDALLQQESVKVAGLGARDSLRLEAGLCLYVVPPCVVLGVPACICVVCLLLSLSPQLAPSDPLHYHYHHYYYPLLPPTAATATTWTRAPTRRRAR